MAFSVLGRGWEGMTVFLVTLFWLKNWACFRGPFYISKTWVHIHLKFHLKNLCLKITYEIGQGHEGTWMWGVWKFSLFYMVFDDYISLYVHPPTSWNFLYYTLKLCAILLCINYTLVKKLNVHVLLLLNGILGVSYLTHPI